MAEAFGLPPDTAGWIAELVGRPRWRAFAAFDGPDVAGGGVVFIDGRSSWLGLGGTKQTARGRGAQSALLAARIWASLEAGADLITTETGVPLEGRSGTLLQEHPARGLPPRLSAAEFRPGLSLPKVKLTFP